MFTKVLIQLMRHPEKPDDPIEFIREHMGASLKEKQHIEILQQEVDFYRQKVDDLAKQLAEAKLLGGNVVPLAVVDSPMDVAKSADAVVDPKEIAIVEAGVSSSPLAAVVVADDDSTAKGNHDAPGKPDEIQAVTEAIVTAIETKKDDAEESTPAVVVPVQSIGDIKPASEPVISTAVPKLSESEEKIVEIAAATAAAN